MNNVIRLSEDAAAQLRKFKDSFCVYPPVKTILNDLESLYQSAQIGGEQSCMLLKGDSGTGKTALVSYFSLTKNSSDNDDIPVLLSRVPSKLTVEDMTRQLLNDLHVFGTSSIKSSQGDAHLTKRLLDALKVKKTKVIIVNEFQELIEFKGARHRQAIANRLKLISEEASVPIVLVGMPWVDEILEDSQWASRVAARNRVLPYLSLTKRLNDYNELLRQLEQHIPCDITDNISSAEIAFPLFAASSGELRQIKTIISEGLYWCLLNNKPLSKKVFVDAFERLYPSYSNPFKAPLEKLKIREVERYSRYIRGDSVHRAAIHPRQLTDFMSLNQIFSKR